MDVAKLCRERGTLMEEGNEEIVGESEAVWGRGPMSEGKGNCASGLTASSDEDEEMSFPWVIGDRTLEEGDEERSYADCGRSEGLPLRGEGPEGACRSL